MALAPLSASSGPATVQDGALAKLSSDYTMFLRLLTTQMQNQDPLSPMDTSQYTQQLVQYSQVEQSIQQSTTLKQILARLSAQDMMQASTMIGRDARYSGGEAGLPSGGTAHWSWSGTATPVTLAATISDASGRVVDQLTLPPGTTSLDWTGQLPDGTQTAPGSYSLALDARDAIGNRIAMTLSAQGRVEAVTQGDNGLELTIAGIPVGADRVTGFALSGGI